MKTKKCQVKNCGGLIILDGRSRFEISEKEICEDCWFKKEIMGVKLDLK